MRNLIYSICIAVYCLLPVDIQIAAADISPPVDKAPAVVAFVNVNVVPMDSERIVPGQTVIVRGDRISEVGPADAIEIPEGAIRIDGSGKYLMPGLADMHVHLNYYDMVNLFLANGVTTVRNMWGSGWHLNMQDRIQKGDLIGPTVHIAGPGIESNPPLLARRTIVKTADQAARIVAEHKKAGYEFIKIYDSLSLECFDAVIEAAAKHGMPVVGHVPEAVSIEHALASGMYSIEHLVGYGPFLELGDSRYWTKIDEEKMSHIAKATKQVGAWNCVTLVVMDKLRMTKEDVEQELKKPHMKYVPASVLQQSSEERSESKNRIGEVSNMKRMVKALHDAGAKILLGTDSQASYVVAGFSIHEELQNLVDSGLTPYEAIRAGTHDAAECLGQLDEFGIVSTGLRADLILVEGNPLEDVSHIKNKTGVMVRGHWLPKEELQERLDRLEAYYNRLPEDRFSDVPALKIEGEKIFSGRYSFVRKNVVAGEERITVARMPDGRNIVYSQLMVDPPYGFFTSTDLIFDEQGKCYSLIHTKKELPWMDSSWSGSFRIERRGTELTASGQWGYGKEIDIKETAAEDTLLGTQQAGSLTPITQIAKSLEVKEKVELARKRLRTTVDAFFNETMTMERAPDGTRQTQAGVIPVKIFNIDVKREGAHDKAVITLDKEHHLLEYEWESATGSFKCVRIE